MCPLEVAFRRSDSPPLSFGQGARTSAHLRTRKARHLAPSRETPEVRDGTPSPAAPQFTMFVLSWLKELKQGADTLGPAHLCSDTFPEPPHPALLTHMHTQPHSITLSHTPVSTQAHKTTPPYTHTHTHNICIHSHTFSQSLTLAPVISSYSH